VGTRILAIEAALPRPGSEYGFGDPEESCRWLTMLSTEPPEPDEEDSDMDSSAPGEEKG
jgi:hypothetical protein